VKEAIDGDQDCGGGVVVNEVVSSMRPRLFFGLALILGILVLVLILVLSGCAL
jgi:hypothetical protein